MLNHKHVMQDALDYATKGLKHKMLTELQHELRQAIKELDEQEPALSLEVSDGCTQTTLYAAKAKLLPDGVYKLYAHPSPIRELSDEDIMMYLY